MSDSTRTPRSTAKPSASDDEIVELRPPADSGFSGTAKLLAVEQALLVKELLNRGYSRVEPAR